LLNQEALDFAHRHSVRANGDNLVVEAGEMSLMLWDQGRLETANPVARNVILKGPSSVRTFLLLAPLR
jgi:hypothetical protein